MLSSIRQAQGKKFKQGYLAEMKLVLSFLEDKVKDDEDLTDVMVSDAKEILSTNIDKIASLNKGEEVDNESYNKYYEE